LRLRKRFTAFVLIFILSTYFSPLFTQQKILQRRNTTIPENYSKYLQNEHRKLIDLNGDWELSAQEQNIRTRIQVPFCYEFKGKASCNREFYTNLENETSWNYLLCCDGINYQCEISINGKFVVKHEGGYTSFTSLIPEGVIRESGNTIEINIDNSLDCSKTLPLKNGSNYPRNFGGIYRDIYILAVPKVFIKQINTNSEVDINYNADLNNKITLTATDLTAIEGNSSEKKFYLKTEILDSSGNIKASSEPVGFSISSNSTIEVNNKLTITNPQYWSPDNPSLYTMRVSILSGTDIIDSYKSDYGVSEISQRSNSFYLNDSELKFKGVNYVEEIMGTGVCMTYDEIEKDIKNIKSLGCNAIKIYGRQASPYLVHICNRYGMMIFEEIPVFNVPNELLLNENYLALCENQLSEMIALHKNNPAVIAYGLGNDFDVSNHTTRNYVSRLAALGKSLDKKLIFYSTRNYENDICRDLVDLVGLNIYDKDIKAVKEITAEPLIKRQKLFIANYGKIINPSNFSGYSDPSSIESQSKFLVDFQKITKSSSLLGSFFISYADWNSDSPNLRFYDRLNPYLRTCGLYDLNREQRSPAIILRKEFLDEDIPNLNIGTYSREAPVIFVLLGLFTFILFMYLINSVRRLRENTARALFRPFIFFTDVREQSLILPLQNVLLAVLLSLGNALFFANLLYYWKDSQLLDLMLSALLPSDSVKILVDSYIISPIKVTLVFTLISFIKIFLITVIIWLFSLGSKYRIGFNSIYTVTVWGMLPTIILLVIGTFYIRILYESPEFAVMGLALAGFIYLLCIYRILKGAYIIFETFFLKSYAYGILVILVIAGIFWFYMNGTRFLSDYFSLIFAFMKN
jgi:beta-galactosidase